MIFPYAFLTFGVLQYSNNSELKKIQLETVQWSNKANFVPEKGQLNLKAMSSIALKYRWTKEKELNATTFTLRWLCI